MPKFKDPETGEITEHLHVTTSFSGGVKKHIDKYRKEIVNKNGLPLEIVKKVRKPGEAIGFPTFTKFNSANGAYKQNVLRKRSQADFKKNIEEKKEHDQSDALNQLKKIVTKS